MLRLITLWGGLPVGKRRLKVTFDVRETEVEDPERLEQGLAVWADLLARRCLALDSAGDEASSSQQITQM